ncbi:Cullin repeat-like-containing domain protein [Haematococcus lacustris]
MAPASGGGLRPLAPLTSSLDSYSHTAEAAKATLNILEQQLAEVADLTAPIFESATSLTWAEQNIAAATSATDELLASLTLPRKVEPVLRLGPGQQLEPFLASLQQLQQAMEQLQRNASLQATRQSAAHAEQVQAQALRQCEAAFTACLQQHSAAALPSASALAQQAAPDALTASLASLELPQFPGPALTRLRALAAAMLQAHHAPCLQLYKQVRLAALQAALQGLGPTQGRTSLALQSSEALDKTAASWGVQLRVWVLLAAAELRLARAVWPAPYEEAVAAELMGALLDDLLMQGRSMAEVRPAPPCVAPLLAMITSLQGVLPVVEEVAGARQRSRQYLQPLMQLQASLASAARAGFQVFESSLGADSRKAQALDGSVHPLAAASLAYLRRLFTFSAAGQVLFGGTGSGAEGAGGSAAMAESVTRVLTSLVQALQVKAAAYKSPALGALFTLNNMAFMVNTVAQAPQLAKAGRRWLEQHKGAAEAGARQYLDLVWRPLTQRLLRLHSQEDAEPLDPVKWRTWVKAHFKALNAALQSIYTEQSAWSVPDPDLRAALRRTVLQEFLPPFKAFFERFANSAFTSNRSKYVRFRPADVRTMVERHLFEGRAMTITMARAQQQQQQQQAAAAP